MDIQQEILTEMRRRWGVDSLDEVPAQARTAFAREYCFHDIEGMRGALYSWQQRQRAQAVSRRGGGPSSARSGLPPAVAEAQAKVAELRAGSGKDKQVVKFPKGASVSVSSRDGSMRATSSSRTDPLWSDEALRDSPNMLAAIDAVSEFLGIGVHGSAALRYQMIEKTLKRWDKRGMKQSDDDGTLEMVSRCRRLLRDAMAQDGQRSIQLAEAHRLVRWQAEVAAAASRGAL